MELTTKNELIAEGQEELIAKFCLQSRPLVSSIRTGNQYLFDNWWHEKHELSFSISWDWLMEAVAKIESLEVDTFSFNVEINKNHVEISWTVGKASKEPPIPIRINRLEHDNKIDFVYRAVLEFVKWYNYQRVGGN
jgi:hypothetical protein